MEEVIEQKKSKSKKILGIPVFLLIILSLSFVAAVVIIVIYQPFSGGFLKTINATIAGTRNEYVTVTMNGDSNDTILTCDNLNDTLADCTTYTEIITLTNSDIHDSHDCIIDTISDTQVVVIYYGISNNQTGFDTFNQNQIAVTLDPQSNLSFSIAYTAKSTGLYPVSTTIDCP
jgi:hypothetical protein